MGEGGGREEEGDEDCGDVGRVGGVEWGVQWWWRGGFGTVLSVWIRSCVLVNVFFWNLFVLNIDLDGAGFLVYPSPKPQTDSPDILYQSRRFPTTAFRLVFHSIPSPSPQMRSDSLCHRRDAYGMRCISSAQETERARSRCAQTTAGVRTASPDRNGSNSTHLDLDPCPLGCRRSGESGGSRSAFLPFECVVFGLLVFGFWCFGWG